MQLHMRFLETARRVPQKVAVVDRSQGRRLTYAQMLVASLMLSRSMKGWGNGQETFLGILLPNSAGAMIAFMASLMAGRVPVMINYATGATGNVAFARKRCGFQTVLTARALLDKLQLEADEGMVFLEDILGELRVFDKIRGLVKSKLPLGLLGRWVHRGTEDETAVILFTSGSEREPRAVQLTHRNFLSNIRAIREHIELREDDVMLSVLPFFHVYGLNCNGLLPLIVGMTTVTWPNPLDYRKVCQLIREEQCTMAVGTPAFLGGYLRQSEPGDFASMRIVVVGADKASDALREGYLRQHGLTLLEGYGATETSPVVSVNTHTHNRPGSIGRLLPGVMVQIRDLQTNMPLPPGMEGKIAVRGDLVMKGYYDDLEETSFRIKDGWYDTGDMGMMDEDGFLWHRGRLRRFVKIGGEMISLVRVEDALMAHLPEGISACVVEIPDPLKGARILAAVDGPVDARKLLKQVSGELPALAVPKGVVELAEFPKMGSGKIDFRTTREWVMDVLARGGRG